MKKDMELLADEMTKLSAEEARKTLSLMFEIGYANAYAEHCGSTPTVDANDPVVVRLIVEAAKHGGIISHADMAHVSEARNNFCDYADLIRLGREWGVDLVSLRGKYGVREATG